jgi:hypothetical protein
MSYANFSYYNSDQNEGALKTPLISYKGEGTSEDPFRLVMLLRHADMADESTHEQARSLALQAINILDVAVSRVSIDLGVSSRGAIAGLKEALRTTSLKAQADTYYSAVVAILYGRRLIAAGIGHVNLWRWQQSAFSDLMQPTLAPLPPEASKSFILSSALGVGFDPESVQSCDISLDISDYAVIAIQSLQSLTDEYLLDGGQSTSDWLNKLVDWYQTKPTLLAVVGVTA